MYRYMAIEFMLSDYFIFPLGRERFAAALSFETLNNFKYEKKQKIYDKLFQEIKQDGYYIECDYIACSDEEETLCLEQCAYKRRVNNIPDDVFIHIDIPLTLEHQIELMENAGFNDIKVLYENCGTMIIKAKK